MRAASHVLLRTIALAPAAGVSVSANAWDTRIEGWGCAPAGCVADNVLDDSLEPEARWSCRGNLFLPGAEFESTDDTSCMLTFKFDGPQDVKELRMALWKGEDRARAVNVWVDGVLATTLDASGATNELEAYELTAASASTVVLEYDGLASDWISITEVSRREDDDRGQSENVNSRSHPAVHIAGKNTGSIFAGCVVWLCSHQYLSSVAESGIA